jgi:hypothetical protein
MNADDVVFGADDVQGEFGERAVVLTRDALAAVAVVTEGDHRWTAAVLIERMRGTEVRPMSSRRAISALLTPAR